MTAETFSAFVGHRRRAILVVSLVATGAAVAYATGLRLESDFAQLLPANAPSARAIERVRERMGGLSTLLLAVEGGDWKKREAFVERLVEALRAAIPPERLGQVDYRVTEARRHFERNWYLYADLDDLREALRRLRARIAEERRRRLVVDLEDAPPKAFAADELTRKYDARLEEFDRFPDGYFITPDRTLQAVLLRIGASGLGDEGTLGYIREVRGVIERLRPEAEGYRVHIAGNPVTAIEERNAVVQDILAVSIACILLVIASIVVYFRSLRALVLLALPIAVGVAVAFAVAELAIGSLTSNTAFLASIIAGNGINFGIILLSRFMEERGHSEPGLALARALAETWRPTASAAAAAALAYGSLGLTDFRGFSQFGLIGAVGIAVSWLATYVSLPALILVLGPRPRPRRSGTGADFARPVTRWLRRWHGAMASIGIVVTVAAAVGAAFYYRDPFEYDFTKLRSKSASRSPTASESIGNRVSPIFEGSGLQGEGRMVILLERAEQAPLVRQALAERSRATGETLRAESLDDLIPPQQDAKLAVLRELRETLDRKAIGWLTPEQRKEALRLRPPADLVALRPGLLPEILRRPFIDREGGVGRVVYVSSTISAFEGRRLLRVADALRELRLQSGEVVRTAGYQIVLADLLASVVADAPLATGASFLAVLVLVFVSFARARDRVLVLGTLVVGVVWMCGAAALLGIKVNMLNFVALPITFGIGVDYAVNIYRRYLCEGPQHLDRVLLRTGGAVALCSLTTIIGYGSLLFSDTQALGSFGLLAVVGEVTTLVTALVFLPALLPLANREGFAPHATADEART